MSVVGTNRHATIEMDVGSQTHCMTDNRDHCAKLLSLAVHEFRTPVAVVAGYLRMLLRHFGDTLTDQQRKLLQESEKSCGNISGLLNELSELAHFDETQPRRHPQPTPLGDLLVEAAGNVQEGRDRGVRLEVRTGERNPVVSADRDHLRTAFATLFTATLRERAEAATVVAACRLVEDGGRRDALIAIGDEGSVDGLLAPGEPSGDAFDEFRGGLGFRLVLASRVIAAHGGRLASPIAARGRLGLVVSLPAMPESETA